MRRVCRGRVGVRGKKMQRPMMGAARRIEGRLGQLREVAYHGKHGINDKLIAEFRLLSRALANECELTADE